MATQFSDKISSPTGPGYTREWNFPIVTLTDIQQSEILFVDCWIIKMKAIRYFETSGTFYATKQRNIRENSSSL